MSLPPLPAKSTNVPWSANIHLAYHVLTDIFDHANEVLRQGDSNPIRIKFHLETLVDTAIPILQALEPSCDDEGLPTAWLHGSAESLGRLVLDLKQAEASAEGR